MSTPADRGAIHRAYESDGYVLVKGLISPDEARAMRQEVHDRAAACVFHLDDARGERVRDGRPGEP